MGAICNGMAAHGGVIPYDATFLIFSDYMRPPMRLAALMRLHVVHVFTHDSIALGEDGPTHQPVEQLVGLRSVPELLVIRPADANETARSEEHTSELQSLMRISYAVFCLKKKTQNKTTTNYDTE